MKELQPLPLGSSDFATLRMRNQIYVDKTTLIYKIASKAEKFFLSRPRRFGKSLLISTFESLFKHGLRDFKGLAIEKLWKDENSYQVVRLDFSEIKSFASESVFKRQFEELLVRSFGRCGFVYRENSFLSVMSQLSEWLSICPINSLVLLIDEYDAPLTASMNNPQTFDSVRGELSRFYAVIKSNDGAIRFFFMTGITKFNKTSIFSELNNLSDLTLDPAYGTLLGYTHDEIEKYFGDYLTRASEILQIEKSQLMDELTVHYDGFCFDEKVSKKVFVPWSLLKFFSSPERGLKDYWFESGGRPTALIEYMKSHSLRNPEEYGKEKSIALKTLSSSSDADSISDIGLLTQAGYLTLKKIEGTTAYVGYPNAEVRTSMAQLYLEQLLNGKTAEQVGAERIAIVLASGNAETVLHKLNHLFKDINYRNYPVTNEATVRAYVQVYMAGAGLKTKAEVEGNHGRSDLEVIAGNRFWVFEFKAVDKDQNSETKLQEAVDQIQARDYGNPTEHQELRRVAMVFSIEKRQFVKWAEVQLESLSI